MDANDIGDMKHVHLPVSVVRWVAGALIVVVCGLVSLGVWVDQRSSTEATAQKNAAAVASMQKTLSLNVAHDSVQDQQIAGLRESLNTVQAQQNLNSQQLASIKALMQQMNDQLRELNNRLDQIWGNPKGQR